jgi:hypothetical protein
LSAQKEKCYRPYGMSAWCLLISGIRRSYNPGMSTAMQHPINGRPRVYELLSNHPCRGMVVHFLTCASLGKCWIPRKAKRCVMNTETCTWYPL